MEDGFYIAQICIVLIFIFIYLLVEKHFRISHLAKMTQSCNHTLFAR